MKIRTYTEQGVTFTEVINDKNLKVVFSNLGAAIFSIRFDNYVMTRNVKEISDFLIEKKYYGKTIGRVSNRMKGNKFRLKCLRFLLMKEKTHSTEAIMESLLCSLI